MRSVAVGATDGVDRDGMVDLFCCCLRAFATVIIFVPLHSVSRLPFSREARPSTD